MGIYTSTVSGGGAEFDRRMQWLAAQEQFYAAPLILEIDSQASSPSEAVTLKDINGNPVGPYQINSNPIFAGIRECCINPDTHEILYSDYEYDGSDGDIMVEYPTCKYKFEIIDNRYYRYGIIPQWSTFTGFVDHPANFARGATIARPKIWLSAYEASGYMDGSTPKLRSATGETPFTGGATAYSSFPNSGRLNIDDAELYANNKGTGYGCLSIWPRAYEQLLFYFDALTLDSQTKYGLGNVNSSALQDTGADSIDSNLNWDGTGKGTGVDGQTPISWRFVRNIWGNIHKWVIGLNMSSTDHTYKITNMDGTGALAGTLTESSYETTTGTVPSATGYISGIQTETAGALAFIPSAAAGSGSTYFCDQFVTPSSAVTVMRVGGRYSDVGGAGISKMVADGVSSSANYIGCRFEYLP